LPLQADVTRLAQVLSNVLINAAKYTAPEGRITLTVEPEGDQALIRVSDNGIGIATQDLSTIFEMFVQVATPGTASSGGQGIGLSLAKRLLELHGGSIAALSDGLGKGSEFQIRLPLARSSLTAERPPGDETMAAPAAPSYRVLVADDLRDAADSLASLLRSVGHAVAVAYDGEQALSVAEAFRPEIAILDLGMPVLDGYEACRRIRASAWGSGITLIAQSGWGQAPDRHRAQRAGFDRHAVKPIELAALLEMFPRPAA
jgi:CheY-like chemotaxis protein